MKATVSDWSHTPIPLNRRHETPAERNVVHSISLSIQFEDKHGGIGIHGGPHFLRDRIVRNHQRFEHKSWSECTSECFID